MTLLRTCTLAALGAVVITAPEASPAFPVDLDIVLCDLFDPDAGHRQCRDVDGVSRPMAYRIHADGTAESCQFEYEGFPPLHQTDHTWAANVPRLTITHDVPSHYALRGEVVRGALGGPVTIDEPGGTVPVGAWVGRVSDGSLWRTLGCPQ